MLFSDSAHKLVLSEGRKRLQVSSEVTRIVFETEDRLEGIGKGSDAKPFTIVCLAHIITELVDKLIWAYDLKTQGINPNVNEDHEVLEIDEPLPVELSGNNPLLCDDKTKTKIEDLIKWHHKVHVQWRTVVKDFILHWYQCCDKGTDGQQPKTPPVPNTDVKVLLKKMFEATENQRTKSQVEKVLSRIHDAALALSSFRLFDLKKWNNVCGDFNFHEAILCVHFFIHCGSGIDFDVSQ